MNALANFVYAKINDRGNESAGELSSLEIEAWKDLQAFLNRSPQSVAKHLTVYPSPAEWPGLDFPIRSTC